MRWIFLFLILSAAFAAEAQKTLTATGSYTYYAPVSLSVEEAMRIALERAKLQAIEDAFGSTVAQSNATIVTNTNGQSDSHFYSMGMSDVKGEWLETVGRPLINVTPRDNMLVVECTVKGKIREILHPEIEMEARVLKNGTSLKFESYDFRDGDDLYLYFRSSVAGNLSIYLRQGDTVYRLLPYKTNASSGKIADQQSYIFFSIQNSDAPGTVEYTMYADREVDHADILILYTPKLPSQPQTAVPPQDEPPSMSLNEFNSWLVKKRTQDVHSKLIIKPITIKSK